MLDEIELTEDIIKKAELTECSICLGDFMVDELICFITCFHVFHSKCIKDWLKRSKLCPMCNTEVTFDEENF